MKIVQEAIQDTGNVAGNVMARLPVLRRVLRLLGGEDVAVDQEALGRSVGRIAVVADFGYGRDFKSQKETARRAADLLRSRGVLGEGSPVAVQAMMPAISERSDACLDRSAHMLAQVLREDGDADQIIEEDPIAVKVDNIDNLTLHAYAGLGKAAPGCAEPPHAESLVVITNQVFAANAFNGLNNMSAGSVAVLTEVGETPEANRFTRQYPIPEAV